jgi:hypothetical protein
MTKNNLKISEIELAKKIAIHVTIKRCRVFRMRWWLFLGLFKILGRICPIRLRVYRESLFPPEYYERMIPFQQKMVERFVESLKRLEDKKRD